MNNDTYSAVSALYETEKHLEETDDMIVNLIRQLEGLRSYRAELYQQHQWNTENALNTITRDGAWNPQEALENLLQEHRNTAVF